MVGKDPPDPADKNPVPQNGERGAWDCRGFQRVAQYLYINAQRMHYVSGQRAKRISARTMPMNRLRRTSCPASAYDARLSSISRWDPHGHSPKSLRRARRTIATDTCGKQGEPLGDTSTAASTADRMGLPANRLRHRYARCSGSSSRNVPLRASKAKPHPPSAQGQLRSG